MSNVLVTFVMVVLADRAIAFTVWLYGKLSFQISLREFYKAYKWVSFPRTLLGACVCLPDILAMFFDVDANVVALAVLLLYLAFGVSSIVDAMRANRSGVARAVR